MSSRVRIVAEAAQGFEGDPTLARLLVRSAAAGRADAVKFQLVYAEEIATPAYQYYDLFRALEMTDEAWRGVADEARKRNVALAFDIYGPRSLSLAVACGAVALKIHSTDFFNDELVDAAIATGKDVWFSIGGIGLDEVRGFLEKHGTVRADQLTLLFGFQAEPTPLEQNNLSRLATLRREFPSLGLGFMDHAESGSDASRWLGAVALPYGLAVIEKHITIGRSLELEDYVSAVDAKEFADYVQLIRAAESTIGSPEIEMNDAERRYRRRAVKVVVASRAIGAGERIERDSITLQRAPLEEGSAPFNRLDAVLGATVRRDVAVGAALLPEDLN